MADPESKLDVCLKAMACRKATKRHITQFLASTECQTFSDTALTPQQRLQNLKSAIINNLPDDFDSRVFENLEFDDCVACLVALGRKIDEDHAPAIGLKFLLESEKANANHRRSTERSPDPKQPLANSQNPATTTPNIQELVAASVERALRRNPPRKARAKCALCGMAKSNCICMPEAQSSTRASKQTPKNANTPSEHEETPAETPSATEQDEDPSETLTNRSEGGASFFQGQAFRAVKVIQSPELWSELLQSEAHVHDLRRALERRYVLPIPAQNTYTHAVHETLVDALEIMAPHEEVAEAAARLIEILERGLVFVAGADQSAVEKFVRGVQANDMAPKYKTAWAKVEKKLSKTTVPMRKKTKQAMNTQTTGRTSRLPDEVWSIMTKEAKEKYLDLRKRK